MSKHHQKLPSPGDQMEVNANWSSLFFSRGYKGSKQIGTFLIQNLFYPSNTFIFIVVEMVFLAEYASNKNAGLADIHWRVIGLALTA